MVRSSNLPDHATLHVQLCFKLTTNLTNSSIRIMNEVRVGYNYSVSMVTKPLRSVFWKSCKWYRKVSFGTTSFELLSLQVVVDLIPHCPWSATTVGGLIFYWRAMPDESEREMSVHKIWCGVRTFRITRHCTSSFASNWLQTWQTQATVPWTKFALVTATVHQW